MCFSACFAWKRGRTSLTDKKDKVKWILHTKGTVLTRILKLRHKLRYWWYHVVLQTADMRVRDTRRCFWDVRDRVRGCSWILWGKSTHSLRGLNFLAAPSRQPCPHLPILKTTECQERLFNHGVHAWDEISSAGKRLKIMPHSRWLRQISAGELLVCARGQPCAL